MMIKSSPRVITYIGLNCVSKCVHFSEGLIPIMCYRFPVIEEPIGFIVENIKVVLSITSNVFIVNYYQISKIIATNL